jgi:hypothetical protein
VNADTIRLLATYGIATLILIGCFVLLLIPSQISGDSLVPFVSGIIGVVIGWAFNRESTTAGARASERSMQQGADTALATPTTVTTQGTVTK